MSTTRLAIIGVGYWGEKLIRVFRTLEGVDVRAVCDHDAERCRGVASGAAICDDVGALLRRDDIDAVVVATPPSSHYALAKDVLDSGRHCWVEKPLALRAVEGRELVDVAARSRKVLFVDETFLYDPLIRTAKQWIDSGRLGKLYHLSFERLGMGRIRRDSDVWWNSAPHDLSILCYLVAGRIETVGVEKFAYVQPGIADMATGSIRFRGGVSAHVYVSWLSPLKAASLVVVGSKGLLHYEGRFAQRALRFFEYDLADAAAVSGNVIPIPRFAATETITGGNEEPLALAAAAFVESIRIGTAAPSAGEYSQRVVELLEAGG